MKKKYISLFLISLLIPLAGSLNINVEKVEASNLPTKINTTDTSDEEIRSYYSDADGKSGRELLVSLRDILKDHTTYSYDQCWGAFKIVNRDWNLSPMTTTQLNSYSESSDNPYVHILYRNDNGDSSTCAHANDTHGTYIDREHVWPKSYGDFYTNAPAGTDLHHLMPGDSDNNQDGHNNFAWGNVDTSKTYTAIGESSKYNNTGKQGLWKRDNTYTVYEPQDCDKGDIARACFYMAARYSVYSSQYDPFLEITDDLSLVPNKTTFTATATESGKCGSLSDLLEWNKLDPVDDFERHRNNLIYNNYQDNRNPFIDFPDWADIAFGNSGKTTNVSTDLIGEFSEETNETILSFQSTETFASLQTTYEVKEGDSITTYNLCTSEDDLVSGDEYVICGNKTENDEENWYSMSNEVREASRLSSLVTVENNSLKISSNTLVLSLIGSESSGWSFYTNNYESENGYLNATESSTSNLLSISTENEYSKFSISFSGTNSIITCLGKDTRNIIRFNGTNNPHLFSCYSNTCSPIYLFRKIVSSGTTYYPVKDSNDKYNISLNFGTSITASLKSELDTLGATSFGVAYKKGTASSFTYKSLDGVFCNIVMGLDKIDETLEEAVSNNHYYQFAIGLYGIPEEDWTTTVTACGYVIINGITYYTNTKSYSVVSIANEYLKNHSSDSAVIAHNEMLTWLASRG